MAFDHCCTGISDTNMAEIDSLRSCEIIDPANVSPSPSLAAGLKLSLLYEAAMVVKQTAGM